MKKLSKSACLTDIHFGKKSNSEAHNQDCLNYIHWFCEQVRNDTSIDHILFLGDWNENRSALNIATMYYSYHGARLLNDLGLPVFFVVGNHDLYHRHTRDIHSVLPFQEFNNFQIIDHPTVITQIANGALLSPFLFHPEYPMLTQYKKIPFWAGHFEFKGFRVTGYGMKMMSGPDAADFAGPTHILSGHFHQRQQSGNVCYIGNTFPMDFSDVDDFARGMAVYDHTTETVKFIDWPHCPKYQRVLLTELLDETKVIHPGANVICTADVPITYEESLAIREEYVTRLGLRDFSIEETTDVANAIVNTEVETTTQSIGTAPANIDELVVRMLQSLKLDTIDNQLLVDLYCQLTI